ncbi:hypothetical protein GSH05_29520, partial [Burkholderia pseudomallei]|nr:hypothetical protein [Burkholderia pseudomallei]
MHHRRRRPTRPALRARSPFLVLRPARGHRQATTPSRVHRAAAKKTPRARVQLAVRDSPPAIDERDRVRALG